MMNSLKPVYDAAVAADAKVNEIMGEMLKAFEEGTEDGKKKAMDMRPALEQAQTEAKTANDLYVTMRDAQAGSDEHARRFVPASEAAPVNDGKQITRAEYEAMSYPDRYAFFKDGGAIVDNPE